MGMSKYTDEFRRDAVGLWESSGRTIASVAAELGLNHETFRGWVRSGRYGGSDHDGPVETGSVGLSVAAKDAELARLRAKVTELARLRAKVTELENREGDSAEGDDVFRQGDGPVSRWGFISQHAARFGVQRLCRLLGVSASGYYKHHATAAARDARHAADAALAAEIKQVHTDSRGTYGSPRVVAELRDAGRMINHKRVERLMRRFAIVGHHLRRAKRTTIGDEQPVVIPDLVERDFSAGGRLDARWCGDITYLPTGQGWLYLATVIDLSSRRLIGWSLADHMRTSLVTDALEAAVTARGGNVEGVIFHSDRGTQYTSARFAAHCRTHRIRRSAGRIASALDNAAAEAFNATLKRETIHHGHIWTTRAQARRDVFAWIAFYNHHRRHSALEHLSPINYEAKTLALAA
ncbi:IS3 family transposase [Phytomonospora sp. NPDC050363]|uniref:IS3 family transposase n=1 Tax=Phytomonospora sp. NPDC050363 TaxID=3155642 RepID=UPI0033E55ACA